MPQPSHPGVRIDDFGSGAPSITAAATSITAFVGLAPSGPVDEPVEVTGFGDFEREFGGLWEGSTLGFAVRDFFLNGGTLAIIVRVNRPEDLMGSASEAEGKGIYALDRSGPFNLLVIPPYNLDGSVDLDLVTAANSLCERRRAFHVIDAPPTWLGAEDVAVAFATGFPVTGGTNSANAAVFFPRLRQPHPLKGGQVEAFAASGAVAGVIARTDAQRGVWKAPAGAEATLNGLSDLSVHLTDADIAEITPLGVNCLRVLPAGGPVVWGSRTMQGADALASEWKYIPVRRTALFIEQSLLRSMQWVVFEPNDEPLWSRIRQSVGTFLDDLFHQGAFQGATARSAYFVKCDRETTTQANIDAGIVNIHVGFAPLKPAEFVVIHLQQIAGQNDTHRSDPYKNFKFKVLWEGRYVAGFSKVGGLKRETEVVDHRKGGAPATEQMSPGGSTFEPITLEGGATHDRAFENWVSASSTGSDGRAGAPPTATRTNLGLEVFNEAGQRVLAYKVLRAWVSEYQAVPDLDANANAVTIQSLKLENEGWERDYSVAEPTQPSI